MAGDERSDDDVTATSMRTSYVRRAAARPRQAPGCASAAGWRAAASTASTSPSSTCATTPASSSAWSTGRVDVRSEYVVRVDRHGRGRRPEGTVNAELATGEVELGDCDGRGAGGGRAAAVPARRPRRDRRAGAPALPLPRPAPRPRCSATCGCAPGSTRRCAPAMDAPGLLRGRDAAAVDADAGGRARVRRARRGCTTASSTCCPRARRSPSSC